MEEKRNYLKEFFDKKDNINYEEILRKTNNANENEINAIKKEIAKLQNTLNEKTNELHLELDKSYQGSYTPTNKRIVLRYNGKSGSFNFDLQSGARIINNEENDTIYTIDTKVGVVKVVVGYSYENALIFIKDYKYSINNDNTFIKTTPQNTYIISFMNNDKYKFNLKDNYISKCDNYDYSLRSVLDNVKDNEFVNEFYNTDYKGKLSLYDLRDNNLKNKSFEIIIKQAPTEIIDQLLDLEIKEPTPIHKILGISLDTYKSAIQRGIIKYVYDNIIYISGDLKVKFNKTESEWLDLIEELKQYEEDLEFYKIDYKYSYYGDSSLLKTILEFYTSNIYLQENYTLSKLINYVVNETINQGYTSIRNFLSELRDYLSMCKSLGVKPTLYSSYLKQTHDITSRNYQIKVESEKEEIFSDRYKDFKPYKTEDYIVIAPKETKDLQEEGSRLNHCVASYIKRVIDGQCLIYFLRKQDKQEESLITLEVKDNAIVQVRGSHNRKPSEEERKSLEQFAKDRKLGVRF